jgi:hypothetical protein
MAFTVNLGSVAITVNPAALLNPVVAHPGSAAATYATFQESVTKSGLVATVFDAFRGVITVNTPASAKVKWPTMYGTTDPPYGTPADPVTGVRAVAVVDEGVNIRRWTDAIHGVSSSRKSFLEHYAEIAEAVAAGIKSVLESKFLTGRATMPGFDGIIQSTVTITAPLTDNMEVFVTGVGNGTLYRTAYLLSRSGTGFVIGGDGGATSYPVSWLVVG